MSQQQKKPSDTDNSGPECVAHKQKQCVGEVAQLGDGEGPFT